MSAIIQQAFVATQAYIRPVQQPVRSGFAIAQDLNPDRSRSAIVSERRTAPAVQITLSPEALDLLARSRNDLHESRERHATGAPASDSDDASKSEGVQSYAKPEAGADRLYQRPGSQIDITL
jgi:hypothetical protein